MSCALAIPEQVEHPLLVHGDALEVMRQLPDRSVNLIATDPPYFRVKAEAWDRQWASAREFLAWVGELAEQWERLLVPQGSLYVFASPEMAGRVEGVIRALRGAQLRGLAQAGPRAPLADAQGRPAPLLPQHRADHLRRAAAGPLGRGLHEQVRPAAGAVFEPLRAYLATEWSRAGLGPGDLNDATRSQMATHYLSSVQWALPTAPKYAQMQAKAGPGYLERPLEDLRREYQALRAEFEARRAAELEHLRRPFAVSREVPYTDVWSFPTVERYPGKHPCEKPRELMAHIIGRAAAPVMSCSTASSDRG